MSPCGNAVKRSVHVTPKLPRCVRSNRRRGMSRTEDKLETPFSWAQIARKATFVNLPPDPSPSSRPPSHKSKPWQPKIRVIATKVKMPQAIRTDDTFYDELFSDESAAQKSSGKTAFRNSLKLRPDEAKRRVEIITKKNAQRASQR